MIIPISIKRSGHEVTEDVSGLLDTGAGGEFMDYDYVKELGLEIMKLDKPIKPRNIDGMLNIKGQITEYVEEDVKIEDRIEYTRNGSVETAQSYLFN